MSSPFIGLQVKLTLHSRPDAPIKAKILSIDHASNTLTIQKEDGSQSVLKRTDIASLTASNTKTSSSTASPKAKPDASSQAPARSHVSTPKLTPQPQQQKATASPTTSSATAASAFVDPAIMSYARSTDIAHNAGTSSQHPHSQSTHLSAPPVSSRSSTPSQSPRPKPAQSKASNKKAHAISGQNGSTAASRGSSPAIPPAPLTDEFDFNAGLAAFDKKRIWDEIRSADNTDPASLLVSHNRIAGSPGPLIRGPNGVGPANSVNAPERGRGSNRDGQQKLRPNEMVLSPSRSESEEEDSIVPTTTSQKQKPEPTKTSKAQAASSHVSQPSIDPRKPSYEELEEKIRKLEAELALARRRNTLLEELAGLGLGVNTRVEEATRDAHALAPTPTSEGPSSSAAKTTTPPKEDPAILSTTRDLSLMALQSSSAAHGTGSEANPSQEALAQPTAPTTTPAKPKEEALFGHIVDPPVLTLFFPTAALQHTALARMEAFYESNSSSKSYLSLQQAKDERICRNYQGFNFPVLQGVKEWLVAMFNAVRPSSDSNQPNERWWSEQCSNEENQLLDLLAELGSISTIEGWNGVVSQSTGNVSYVISTTASQAHSTLPHELLHALYFLSSEYRSFVSTQWSSLSSSARKVIENDLSMRKYSAEVYEDEFQAYLAEGLATEKEFGNKTANECKGIAQELRDQVPREWKKLGFSLEGKEDKWEDVKWQTLDRYAAFQKANSDKKKGSTGKGAKKSKK